MLRASLPDGGGRWVSGLVIALLVGVGATLVGTGAAAATADTGSQPASGAGLQGGDIASLAQEQTQVCNRSARPLVGAFNSNIDIVPKFLRGMVRDTEIHGVFHNDTQEDYTFVTDTSGTIQSFSAGRPESPSLRMITDCETLVTIIEADEPTAAFRSEYRSNEIRFVGVGIFNWLLVAALTHLPLLVALLLLVVAYVVYRRYSIFARGERGESGLRRTDADEPSTGDGGDGSPPETGGDGGSGGSGGDGG